MSDLAINTTSLNKAFGSTRALNNFNISVPTGEVRGFLGPNGAGKSTVIRILLGMLHATSGSAQVFGMDPWRDSVALHHRLAYVAGDTNLWPNLSGGEAIDLLTRHQRSEEQKLRRAELIDRFELDPTKKARTYSKGNRQKVALISALSLDVDLYLLDEPTSGLDPLMESIFTEEIRKLRDEGRTVLLSSHILGEVEKLCDSVTIIREGTDVEHGTLTQLRHLTRSAVAGTLAAQHTRLESVPGVHDMTVDGERFRCQVEDHNITEVLKVLSELDVHNLTITPPSLEDLFLRHYMSTEEAHR